MAQGTKTIVLKRELRLKKLLEEKSFFLFGPRKVGKTFLVSKEFFSNKKKNNKFFLFDLLDYEVFHRLSLSPSDLEKQVLAALSLAKIKTNAKDILIIIDEIQKIPMLLDEVHRLIEKHKWKFLLTGSSARSLKRKGANLLAGRAWNAYLYPLTFHEIGEDLFELERYLLYGGLPFVYLSENPREELLSYRNNYLKEEVQMEAFVKNISQFSRFFEAASISSGQILNFSKLGNDYGISPSTVREYYSILEETFVGFFLEPWVRSKKRKAISRAKFYLFDTGVMHSFLETKTIERHSDLFGKSFEHFIIQEVRAYVSYKRLFLNLGYWKSVNKQEVDLTIGEEIAIEVKSAKKISSRHLRNLKALQQENVFKKFFLVSLDPLNTLQDGIHCLHWSDFLRRLWKDEFLKPS